MDDNNGNEKFIKNGDVMSDGAYKLRGVLYGVYQVEESSNNVAVTTDTQNKNLDKMI